MKRLASIIAATATAAAVAAAISLPAGADGGARESDALDTFAACLRAHDVAVPTGLDAIALKTWIGDHEDSPGVQSAVEACNPKPDERKKASGPAPEELVTCLRDRGLAPPSSIGQLKPWIAQQADTADGNAALSACGIDSRPVGCAGEKSPAAERAKASRAKAAGAQ